MNNKKKKSDENVCFVLAENYTRNNAVIGHKDFKEIKQLTLASSCSEQTYLLEELQKSMCGSSSLSDADQLCLQILCDFYFQTPIKSPLRKRFHRFFVCLNEKNGVMVDECLSKVLKDVIKANSSNSCLDPTCITAVVAGLLEGFSVGKQTVFKNALIVCSLLCSSIEKQISNLTSENSIQARTSLYSSCQSSLRSITILLQNCVPEFSAYIHDSESEISVLLNRTFSAVSLLLLDAQTPSNCRTNAAYLWCTILNLKQDFSFMDYINNDYKDEMYIKPKWDEHSPVSKICICGAVLGVVSVEILVSKDKEEFLAFKILQEITSAADNSKVPDVLLLSGRTLLQWTHCMLKIISSGDKKISHFFSENGASLKILMQYVLANSEHYIDGLQYFAREIFENTIKLYQISVEVESTNFLKQLSKSFLEMPFHCRGKYAALCSLSKNLGASVMLELKPTLSNDLYQALMEPSLACNVSNLMGILFIKHSGEVSMKNFVDSWIEPLIHTLCHGSKQQRIAIVQNVLPKLFAAYPKSFHNLINRLLAQSSTNQDDCFCALIACVKFSETCAVNKEDIDWVPYCILQSSLCHSDNDVRLSAFSLICDPQKTTKIITDKELELMRHALPWNICCQCPAFRQQFVAYLRKFLLRLKENYTALYKKKGNDSSLLISYENFIKWLVNFLLSCLHPGANFPRRGTALNLISVLYEIFESVRFSDTHLLQISNPVMQTLIESLRDTYENNKQTVSTLFSKFPFEVELPVTQLLDVAISLVSSTKPPDSVTAAYIFKILVNFKNVFPVMHKYLEKYESRQTKLRQYPVTSRHMAQFSILQLLLTILNEQLIGAEKDLLTAAAHGPLYGVLFCIRNVLNDVAFDVVELAAILFWKDLLEELTSFCFRVGNAVIVVVCNSSPEGYLPMDTDEESADQMHSMVQNSIAKHDWTGTKSACNKQDSLAYSKIRAVTAQMLLLCSWRTHKEISLLFGDIAEKVPVSANLSSINTGLIAPTLLLEIGQYFTFQLSQVKHRGAFEQAYVGFYKLCHKIWRTSVEDLQKLPHQWLKELFALISGEVDSFNLCSSRRSAGIPFMVQAILITEPELNGSVTFREAMNYLLQMALVPAVGSFNTDCMVHSLNVLRALFRDSCLGECVMGFVADGLKASILGFKSSSWAVRNSATLLFSALMTRIFGVNRSREEIQKKNCLSGFIFFTRFPTLFEFLFVELEHIVSKLNSKGKEMSISVDSTLCPILHVLGRLYPSPMGKNKSPFLLADFVPLVFKCAGSVLWKTRVLAAKALYPLLMSDELPIILKKLFCSISSAFELQNQNMVHGFLLQVICIMKELQHLQHLSVVNEIKMNLPVWISSSMFLIRHNSCYVTVASFIEVLCHSFALSVLLDDSVVKEIIQYTLKEIYSSEHSPGKEQCLVVLVVFVLYYISNASEEQLSMISASSFLSGFSLKQSCTERIVLSFVSSPIHEVQLSTFDYLHGILCVDGSLQQSEFLFIQDFCQEKVSLRNRILIKKSLRNISEVLVDIATKEEVQSGCLSKLFRLLCFIPESITCEWAIPQKNCNNIQKVNWLLGRLSHQIREDLKDSMLLFSVHLVNSIYEDSQCAASQNNEMKDVLKDNCASRAAVSLWANEIERNAHPGNTIERRQIVLSVLHQIKNSILVDNHKILIGTEIVPLWKALLLLLTDDEPEVKDNASTIVLALRKHYCSVPGNSILVQTIPTLSLNYFLELFKIQFENDLPNDFISVMLDWMLQCVANSAHEFLNDEQPFDKGEMNIFFEELHLTRLASQWLCTFLSNNTNVEELRICHKSVKCKGTFTSEKCTIQEFIVTCIDNLKKLVSELQYLPFTSRKFDNQLLRMFQLVEVITSLWSFAKCNVTSTNVLKCLLKNVKCLPNKNLILTDIISKLDFILMKSE